MNLIGPAQNGLISPQRSILWTNKLKIDNQYLVGVDHVHVLRDV